MPLADHGLEILSEDDCRQLLRQAVAGRVGLSIRALPVIPPVNYVLIDDRITFWTAPGMKLDAAQSHTVVAFEVDHIDEACRCGWSVLVVGVATLTKDPETLDRAHRAGLHRWVHGDRPYLVQVPVDFISGRRIITDADDMAALTRSAPTSTPTVV